MARRQTRFSAQDMANDPRLKDESPTLWGEEFGDVAAGMLSSAVKCFASIGFNATTTRDISAGVGLSPAALYVHFTSKELVLFQIARIGHEAALAFIESPEVAAATDSRERLRLIVSRFVAWHARHHACGRICQYELSALSAEHYEAVTELRRSINLVFREAVRAGVQDGSFAEVDVDRVVRGMLSLGIDLVRWYRLDGPDSPEQIGEFYADLALSMVAPGTPAADGPACGRGASRTPGDHPRAES